MGTTAVPPPDGAPARSSPRYHDLDVLRATAMLLGIVLHAALFLVLDVPWHVHEEKASWDLPYAAIVGAIHGFRMPVFFLISGFFTAMLWQHRGLRGLLKQRLLRVGLPLLTGCVTIIPLTVWLGWFVVPGLDLAAVFPEGTPPVAMGVWFWLFSWLRDFSSPAIPGME